jgi:hypothetical protein
VARAEAFEDEAPPNGATELCLAGRRADATGGQQTSCPGDPPGARHPHATISRGVADVCGFEAVVQSPTNTLPALTGRRCEGYVAVGKPPTDRHALLFAENLMGLLLAGGIRTRAPLSEATSSMLVWPASLTRRPLRANSTARVVSAWSKRSAVNRKRPSSPRSSPRRSAGCPVGRRTYCAGFEAISQSM